MQLNEGSAGSRKYVIISADGHAGADVLGYKPYLASDLHAEFDSWAASYADPWSDLDVEDEDHRMGVCSFGSSVNWDSAKRNDALEEEGIVAEILFPNTAPPFFPSGAVGAHPPADPQEYLRRFAGLQAHNRWLADFCGELPGRRAGIAQIFLNDVDRAVQEVRWASQHGLKGVMLPPDHMLQLSNLYYPRFEPFWTVCEELQMPLHRHGVVPSEAASETAGDAAPAIGLTEASFFAHRPLSHLILSGVFERHPDLKLVMAENRAAGVLPILAQLDVFVKFAQREGSVGNMFAGKAMAKLPRLPSEYLRSNVYHGSFFDSADIKHRHEVGIDRMMWGADYPHHEGTSPYTREALRMNFSALPEQEVRQITSLTAMDVYGFDGEFLQKIADKVGPTVEEIRAPVSLTDIPQEAQRYCPTFGEANFAFRGAATA